MCVMHAYKHRRGRKKREVINKKCINNEKNEKKCIKKMKIGLNRIEKKKNVIPMQGFT